MFVDKIAKDYANCVLKKKKIKSKYLSTTIKDFEKIFNKNFLLCKQQKCKNLSWLKYFNYYKTKFV